MGLTELLTIIFVIMKCTGYIDWNWFLVLLPEIIAAGFYVLIVISSIMLKAREEKAMRERIRNMFRDKDW